MALDFGSQSYWTLPLRLPMSLSMISFTANRPETSEMISLLDYFLTNFKMHVCSFVLGPLFVFKLQDIEY